MVNEIKTWLSDIKQAIDEIKEFLPKERNFLEFRKDVKTKRAIERNIEIIGEAVGRILKKDPNFNITNARKIIDTRNRVKHGYDSVSEEIIWSIVVRDMPNLKMEIDNLLGNENGWKDIVAFYQSNSKLYQLFPFFNKVYTFIN